MSGPAERARELQRLLIAASPLIEDLTGQVCPACVDVCCRQKHGMFTTADRRYLANLGTDMPLHDPARDPDGLCQFLGPDGCSKPRWQRAWKCTWFFCDPLLGALSAGDAKRGRELSALLEQIGLLYGEMNAAE